MKARKFVLIYFKTVKATQGKKKKKIQRDTKSTKKMSSRQNKENHGCKTNLANSLGAGYARVERVVAVCDLEVVLAMEKANNVV